MRQPVRNAPLLVCLVASIAMHVMAILPLFRTALGSEAPLTDMHARFDPEDFAPPPEEVEDFEEESLLGIDRPDQLPTMTWIGHEEYQEHLAKLAEVEQAAFTPDAAAAGQRTPNTTDGQGTAPAPEPVEPDTPPEPEEPEEAPEPEPEPEAPEPETEVAEQEPQLSPADLIALESLIQALEETPAPIAIREAEPKQAPETEEPPVPAAEVEDWLEQLRKATQPKPVVAKKPTPPVAPAPKSPPGEAAVAGAEPNPGDQAEKESDATSITEVPLDKLKPGKPIARQGLALHPRRPRFTNLVRVTAAAGNPLVEIRFGKNGKPSLASILESSGDRRIDHAIESSLYRWRATGPPLEALAPKATIDVKMRIILNRRGRR